MPHLRETQSLFWQLISAPDGVADAVASLPDRERTLPQGLDGVIRGDDRLDAVERLGVYAGMYAIRLFDCLAEDFPALHAAIGHEEFHGVARDYLIAYPSEHPSLRQLGRRLSSFLETHALDDERPWLADLARFEWALLEAFDAPDADPMAADVLRSLSGDDWAGLRLTLSPSLRTLRACAPVEQLWSAASEERELPTLPAEPTILRIWREDLRVFHRTIDEVELAALEAVLAGATFADVCERVAREVGEEEAAGRAVALLQRWFGDSLVVGVAF